MKEIIMKFKDFEFPVNPKKISISASRNTDETPSVDTGINTRNISVNPVIITGEGELYCNRADEYLEMFLKLLKESSSGLLSLPAMSPFYAYFTDFSYALASDKGCVEYSFRFVQSKDGRKANKDFGYTYAQEGENLFDIAHRCNTDISDIMDLNIFMTPFDVNEGDKVVLR